ncbi:hypothetical protein [Aliiglaciecola litoralis]|uniref:Uncharacterized protein n=1 Tax=Aliiglaciecola litoralis TaxID=582857 RepID=A0ABP3WYS1_9ALTE
MTACYVIPVVLVHINVIPVVFVHIIVIPVVFFGPGSSRLLFVANYDGLLRRSPTKSTSGMTACYVIPVVLVHINVIPVVLVHINVIPVVFFHTIVIPVVLLGRDLPDSCL